MIDAGNSHPWSPEVVAASARFKQGALVEQPPFFYAAGSRHGVWAFTRAVGDPSLMSELLEIDPADGPPFGLITTQTCDLNEQSPRPKQPWLMVAPVYQADTLLDQSQRTQVEQGQIGHLVMLAPPPLPAGIWVADLRIEVPLEKSWLVGKQPIEAFPDEDGYLRLARRLAQRRERPALDNVLSDGIVRSLRDGFRRLRGRRHQLVAQIREIRLFVDGTRLAPTAARLLVITHAKPSPAEVTRWFDSWWDEARSICQQQGLSLLANRYATLDTMTAADYVTSVPLDFDYLSPDD